MNKEELIAEIKHLQKLLKKEKDNVTFLLSHQKEIKKLAEIAGGDAAQWKHRCLRCEDELEKRNI